MLGSCSCTLCILTLFYTDLSANFCNYRITLETPKTELFLDDKQMPIYSRVTSGYPIGDLVSILLRSDSDQEKVCSVQPLSVTENASFVVDVDVVNFNDLKALVFGAQQELKSHSFASHPQELCESQTTHCCNSVHTSVTLLCSYCLRAFSLPNCGYQR